MKIWNVVAFLGASVIGLSACGGEEPEKVALAQDAPAATAPAATAPGSGAPASTAPGPVVTVYKTPTCGCCTKWVDHLKEHGFAVEVMDMPDLSMVKQKYMIGDALQSCHTAVVGDYAIEGHVPADLIQKLLKEKPAVAGLAVPGMPAGSPGMESAFKEKYDVLTFDRAGRTTVYAQR